MISPEPTMKQEYSLLPLYKVLLHNDDTNVADTVAEKLVHITKLSIKAAVDVTNEAHKNRVSIIKIVHKELAELYQEQLTSCGITVTIEP